ncbi:Ig-like domain-containing protein, partial [Bacteroidota bacterium]
MKQITHEKGSGLSLLKTVMALCVFLVMSFNLQAQVLLENEIKISDLGLYFDGSKVTGGAPNTGETAPYDYYFGKIITPHGDCIKTYNEFVFMTWYRGGKADRHVMLTRYNTITGTMKTIEFPHQHNGYQNNWWIGESHNTIAVAVSPLDGTIHLLYDMHAYSATKPSNGSLANDYFRYSYSVAGAASVSDADFNLSQFVEDNPGDYKHISLNGNEDYAAFSGLTYPQFFLNDAGDLFMYMREGGNNNGAYKFSKYTASTSSWSNFTHFNVLNAKAQGQAYNWGLYGNMKYVNGKIRIGFQRRSSNNNDKYQYQNGVYYAYSDNQDGLNSWKNHSGQAFSLPLLDADLIKVVEPGDYVQTTAANQVRIVDGFDWTVTDQGDVHMISKVKDNEFNVTKYLHSYKPAGATDFITTEDFTGATSIYTAGNNVYIIGLTSGGRVFVEKAVGGTNNFTRVYEATGGRIFSHGRVHIADGKLYYYLMEKLSGDAQPLYLQVIDLDLNTETPAHTVSLTSPDESANFVLGDDVTLSANTTVAGGSTIAKVNFRINGAFYKQDNTAPYSILWTPVTSGTYTIDAVAYDANNVREYSQVRTVTVNAEAASHTVTIATPSNNASFNLGESINLGANTTVAGGAVISKVNFRVNGAYFGQDTAEPYAVTWTPSVEGVYTIDAVAYDANNIQEFSSVVTVTINNVDISGTIYRVVNVATNRYMDSDGKNIVTSTDFNGVDKEWDFVNTEAYYNINSRVSNKGILRAASGDKIIGTNFSPPRADVDKQWTAILQADGSYVFENRSSGQYLYNETNNKVIHSASLTDRSRWRLETIAMAKKGIVENPSL